MTCLHSIVKICLVADLYWPASERLFFHIAFQSLAEVVAALTVCMASNTPFFTSRKHFQAKLKFTDS